MKDVMNGYNVKIFPQLTQFQTLHNIKGMKLTVTQRSPLLKATLLAEYILNKNIAILFAIRNNVGT